MRLNAGTDCPPLVGEDYRGPLIDLANLRGQPVLLSFYRYAGCPICNLRVHQLIQAYPRLQSAGLRLMGVFQSPAAVMARNVGEQHPPFALIADPQLQLYRRFGVEQRWLGLFNPAVMVAAVKAMAKGFWPGAVNGPLNRVPADLLIDAQGRVAIAHYGQHLDDHLPLATIEHWLAEHHHHE